MRLSLMACTVLAVGAMACSGDDDAVLMAGSYSATAFTVTPTGQSAINVLAAGGSLTLTITPAGVTSGSLNLPASVTGGAALVASMAGTAVQTGVQVTLTQSADTFVRNLTWTVAADGLSVTAQSAGGATYTITLTRA